MNPSRSYSPSLGILTVSILLAGLLGGCHHSSSGGGTVAAIVLEDGANDTAAQAQRFQLTQTAIGDVTVAGDIDYWKISLSNGQIIQVEIFGSRVDQATWDTANNVPRLTLYDEDGTSKLLEQDYSGNASDGWSWGKHDLDLALFRVPSGGTYYLAVTQDDDTIAGGSYGLRVDEVALGTIVNETEDAGVSGDNDTWDTAEAITPSIVAGFHVDDESDYFSFAVTAPCVVRFTLTACRNGVYGGDDSYFDPEIYLYDTDGVTELDGNDDSYYYDSSIHFLIDTAGTYFIAVEECCGEGDAPYFLEFTSTAVAGATAETEPNDDTTTAQAIAYGSKVDAAMEVGDPDYFSFTGTAGDMVRVQVFDLANHQGASMDVDLEVVGPDGVTTLEDNHGSNLQILRTILQESGTHYLLFDDNGTATDYYFEITRFRTAAYETETNDAIAEADALDANGLAAGVIDPTLESDFFSFTATVDVPTTITIYADDADASDGFGQISGHGSSLSPTLNIYNAGGTLLASSTDGPANDNVFTEGVIEGLPTAAVSFLPAASGTYYVEVLDADDNGGEEYYYVLEQR